MVSRMLHRSLVHQSIENERHDRCVDIFERGDKTFGFEEFRKDAEDPGWTVIGHFGALVFASQSQALSAATASVPWLSPDNMGQL